MKQFLFGIFAFLFCIQAEAESLLLPGIKGIDDRILVPGNEYPWSAIGRLNRRIGGFCTGVLIGPRTVLTAAHCLWNHKTLSFLPPVSLHFLAGYSYGKYIAHAKVVKVEPAPGYHGRKTKKTNRIQEDWALVTLDKNLSTIAGYLSVTPLDRPLLQHLHRKKAVFVQAGYSQDRAHILSVHLKCDFDRFLRFYFIVRHKCDAVHGDSGSPVFLFDGNRFTVAAIHIATTHLDNKDGTKETWGLAIPGILYANHVKDWNSDGPPPGVQNTTQTAAILLSRLGYPSTDPLTNNIRVFQRDIGKKETGIADYALIGEMIGLLK